MWPFCTKQKLSKKKTTAEQQFRLKKEQTHTLPSWLEDNLHEFNLRFT